MQRRKHERVRLRKMRWRPGNVRTGNASKRANAGKLDGVNATTPVSAESLEKSGHDPNGAAYFRETGKAAYAE